MRIKSPSSDGTPCDSSPIKNTKSKDPIPPGIILAIPAQAEMMTIGNKTKNGIDTSSALAIPQIHMMINSHSSNETVSSSPANPF